jgi:PAS domain-containing protein
MNSDNIHTSVSEPEKVVSQVLEALRSARPELLEAFDELSAPVYTTDAQGRITWFNQACVSFAGRRPQIGADRWCVSWKLYQADGTPLPHDECPLAASIRRGEPVRGAEAVAERPDGTRIRFRPYPTPLLDRGGEVVGAVNLLLDLSGEEEAEALRMQARRCRRLAQGINDQKTVITLNGMASQYEEQARALHRLH